MNQPRSSALNGAIEEDNDGVLPGEPVGDPEGHAGHVDHEHGDGEVLGGLVRPYFDDLWQEGRRGPDPRRNPRHESTLHK